jgi:post-segregation antitoxin (ccd killing protein)
MAGLRLRLPADAPDVCIVRRMPRLQVYLPDDLYHQVKARGLPASELLQEAVRAEVRRQDLLSHTDDYLDELVAEVGAPSAEEVARAEAIARRIRERAGRQAAAERAPRAG